MLVPKSPVLTLLLLVFAPNIPVDGVEDPKRPEDPAAGTDVAAELPKRFEAGAEVAGVPPNSPPVDDAAGAAAPPNILPVAGAVALLFPNRPDPPVAGVVVEPNENPPPLAAFVFPPKTLLPEKIISKNFGELELYITCISGCCRVSAKGESGRSSCCRCTAKN